MSGYIADCFQSLLDVGFASCTLAEIETALFGSIEVNDTASELQCRLLRAKHLLTTGVLNGAEQDFQRALTIATDLNLADTYLDLVNYGMGHIRTAGGDIEEALSYLNTAVQQARKIGRKSTEVSALLTLSAVYTANGNLSQAIQFTREASLSSRESKLLPQQLRSLLLLAELYLLRGDTEEALRVSSEAVEVAPGVGGDVFVCRANVRHATVLVEAGEQLKAAASLDSIEAMMAPFSRTSLGATFELTRAKIAAMSKDGAEAVTRYEAANLLLEELGEPRLLVNGLSLYADFLCDDSRFGEAIAKLNEALPLAKQYEDTQGIATCTELLGKAYAAMKNFELAFAFSTQQREAEKKLAADEADAQLRLLRIEHEVERREKEKEDYRMRSNELEKDLATSTLTLLAQTELLSNFRDSLREIVRRIPPTEPAIRELKEKLKELPCTSVDWVKFEAQFLSVHPEFKSKLMQSYPTLTGQETKMCLLVRLGLKNFEIARLVCLSERSVENHRFHLRKKLGLKTEQSLSHFLQSI